MGSLFLFFCYHLYLYVLLYDITRIIVLKLFGFAFCMSEVCFLELLFTVI